MEKIDSLLVELKKAVDRLNEVLILPSDNIVNQDASIQRFEFTFELSWKLMNEILKINSIEAYGVKSVIRESARLGLIDNPEAWFEFLEDRNITTHTYVEDKARSIYGNLKNFPVLVENLLVKSVDFK